MFIRVGCHVCISMCLLSIYLLLSVYLSLSPCVYVSRGFCTWLGALEEGEVIGKDMFGVSKPMRVCIQ